MAKSPFQTSGNVGDIAPVQLKGGFTPDTGIASALIDTANAVMPVIQKNFTESITNDVTGRAGAVSLALKATRFPSIQSSIFSEEALANPNVAMALKEFTLIQDATKQGRLPSTFALERLELIQNNAIRNAPEFEAEIRGALRDAAGVDPKRALTSSLFNESKANNAEQKAEDKLTIEARQLNMTVDDLIAMNHELAMNKLEASKLDLAAKQGTYNIQTLKSDVINRGAGVITDIMGDLQRLNTAGVTITPDIQRQLVAKVNTTFGATTSALLAKTAGLSVSGTAISAELTPLAALRDNTIKMIEDGTMQKALSQNSKLIIASTKNSLLNNPKYVAAYAIGGSRGFLDLLKFMSKSKSKEGKALTAALNKDAKIAFDMQDLLEQYSIIGTLKTIVTPKDKQARVVAAGIALGTVGIKEEFQMAALNDIKKYGGEELAWSSFSSNQVLTATAKSTSLKAAFINIQATTTAGLSTELVELSSDPDVQLERLVLTDEGLIVTPRTQVERVGLSQTAALADASMITYAKRFNRANSISAKYNGAGLLPSTRYKGSEMYWNTVRGAAADVVAPAKDTSKQIIKWGRDENGKPIRITGGN